MRFERPQMRFKILTLKSTKPVGRFYGNAECRFPCDAVFLSCFSIRVPQVFLKSPNSRENISEHSSTACGDTWAVLKLSTRRGHSAETATQKQLSKSRACAGQSSPSSRCNAELCTPIQSCTIFELVFPSLSPYGSINWSYNREKGTTDILQLFFPSPPSPRRFICLGNYRTMDLCREV